MRKILTAGLIAGLLAFSLTACDEICGSTDCGSTDSAVTDGTATDAVAADGCTDDGSCADGMGCGLEGVAAAAVVQTDEAVAAKDCCGMAKKGDVALECIEMDDCSGMEDCASMDDCSGMEDCDESACPTDDGCKVETPVQD